MMNEEVSPMPHGYPEITCAGCGVQTLGYLTYAEPGPVLVEGNGHDQFFCDGCFDSAEALGIELSEQVQPDDLATIGRATLDERENLLHD